MDEDRRCAEPEVGRKVWRLGGNLLPDTKHAEEVAALIERERASIEARIEILDK